MTDIYLDPIAAGMPDAVDQLRHLTDTGHRVLTVGDPPETLAAVPSIGSIDALPARPGRGSWLVTGDPELCGDRRPPMLIMLVGPRPAPSPHLPPRCDAEARDLAGAVLEILRHEAMG